MTMCVVYHKLILILFVYHVLSLIPILIPRCCIQDSSIGGLSCCLQLNLLPSELDLNHGFVTTLLANILGCSRGRGLLRQTLSIAPTVSQLA